ncbi:MAG TPA: phosphoribosyltransferase family protein [Candidatus Limnocylindrales bacterium]|nr:phosphoribosyltransferase family protein [Candidatus Limnocylindrales bacterium]
MRQILRPRRGVIPGRFRDRVDAGIALADLLSPFAGRPNLVVLAIPRGGVPVGYQVAKALKSPLDVIVVRKLGSPGQPELAMGAIASGGVRVIDQQVVAELGVPASVIDRVATIERRELERRERMFRAGRPALDPRGCTVMLVDDGLATGSTMRAAIAAIRQRAPAAVIVAVPVGAPPAVEAVSRLADGTVCGIVSDAMRAVGDWYEDFTPTTDAEVADLLTRGLALTPRGMESAAQAHTQLR